MLIDRAQASHKLYRETKHFAVKLKKLHFWSLSQLGKCHLVAITILATKTIKDTTYRINIILE